METNRAVIDKIKYLYKRLYKAELFSSSLTVHMNERDDFYEYSRQHQPAFKIAMMELLMNPDEMNARIPFYCCYILHEDDFIKLYENKKDKLPLNEDYVWDECNLWICEEKLEINDACGQELPTIGETIKVLTKDDLAHIRVITSLLKKFNLSYNERK